jgi:hypothetical protein
MRLLPEEVEEAVEAVEDEDAVVVVCHVRPVDFPGAVPLAQPVDSRVRHELQSEVRRR